MSIAIVVEDGTGTNAAANSYASLQQVKDFCTLRGLSLPNDDEAIKAAMMLSMDAIEARREEFQGHKSSAAQPLQFPRKLVRVDSYELASDFVPTMIVLAQCRATYEVTQGLDLQPIVEGLAVIEDTTGPLTTKYAELFATENGQQVVQSIEAMLKPLFIKRAGFGRFNRAG